MIDAAQAVKTAQANREATQARHERERLALLVKEYGAQRVRRDRARGTLTNPHGEARNARTLAATARAQAAELSDLPPNEAALRVEVKHTAHEQAQRATAQRARQPRDPYERDTSPSDPRRNGPGLEY